ncbi:GNAT family N-acetyltransferase [Halostella pelagica]|uniref:GNAT family N-acetyltransferase n=1 Tax=Halostella pelagica TaxID=2583824 RepID=UPI0010819112|nr:GNAT family protein [Halostella pelagica]
MPGATFLRGETVSLRTVESDDIEFLRDAVNHPDVWRTTLMSTPKNSEQEREFFEEVVSDEDSVDLLVTADDRPVGMVSLNTVDEENGVGELGYWIVPDEWGNGYATDAARTLTEYAFDQRRLHRVQARVVAFNDASARVLEKAGFEREGVHREAVFVDGEHRDVVWYARLVTDQ